MFLRKIVWNLEQECYGADNRYTCPFWLPHLIEKGAFVLPSSVGKRDFGSLCGQIRDYNRKLCDVPTPSFYFVEIKIDG